MRLKMLTVVLGMLVCALALGQVIEIPLNEWGACPEWTPYEKSDKYASTFENGIGSFTSEGGGGTMIWVRNPTPRLDVSKMKFVSLRYRLMNTDPKLVSYLLYFDTGDSGGMYARNLIFGAEDLIHDGKWHTVTTTLYPFGEIGTMALRIKALEGMQGRLEVAYLRLSSEPPRNALKKVLDWQPGEQGLAGRHVPIPATAQLAETQQALDLSDWFPADNITAQGVNFQVPLTGAVSLATPGEPREKVTVPVGQQGQAMYLLLGAKYQYKMLNYAGWGVGDMTDRPEQFRVRLNYTDGTSEEQVPYCLSYGRHGVWRGVNVYALPLANKPVRDMDVYDGMRTSTFYLMAVTVADKSLAPVQEEAAKALPVGREPGRRYTTRMDGDLLTFVTGTGEVQLRADGIVALKNAVLPQSGLRAQAVPLFSIKDGKQTWTAADFKVVALDQNGLNPTVLLRSEAAQLEARLLLGPREREVALQLELRNTAAAPRELEVRFPQLALATQGPADLWYFMPTACATWSNRDQAYEYPYSGDLPAQFVDVYDGRTGGGVYLATRSRDLRQRYFQVNKRGAGATVRIEYRFNPALNPGEWVRYPETVIGLHGGDWKPALEAYRQWFASWYKPSHKRPDWYKNVWNFRTWWTHTMGDGNPEHNLLDTKSMVYQTDKFLRRDREQFGNIDMVHFFDWRWTKKYGLWGDYAHYEEELGGLDKFRGMIKSLQDEKVRVGLYLDTYLCSRLSDIGKLHGEEWAIHGEDGKVRTAYSTPEDPMLNMCVNHPGWQDYLAQTCTRVARETGCDGIYLDEGMSDYQGYWCWRKDHGHPLPGVNQAGLLELCRKVRTALPEDVAFYTEWAPPDALIPYLDGAYQAALGHYDNQFTPGFLQTARFLYPDFRVFTVSNGGSMYDAIWEGVKYNVFSGVPLYSLSWGHDEECLPLFRKMSKVMQDNGDAFNTTRPRPFIACERADVYCNEFPGQKKTVWTFLNGRYRTVSGPVLRVKHVPGAKYMDVWNDKPLQPKIVQGMAVIETELGPRGLGVVSQVCLGR